MDDEQIESFINCISNNSVQVIGPELIFGKIYDSTGFNKFELALTDTTSTRSLSVMFRLRPITINITLISAGIA